jgi:hypothetical protein
MWSVGSGVAYAADTRTPRNGVAQTLVDCSPRAMAVTGRTTRRGRILHEALGATRGRRLCRTRAPANERVGRS